MPIDVNPIQNAVAVRPALPQPPAAPLVQAGSSEAGLANAGITVETGPSLETGSPPIDSERVEEIRRALEDGSYPVVPTRIADAMIAARLMLSVAE